MFSSLNLDISNIENRGARVIKMAKHVDSS